MSVRKLSSMFGNNSKTDNNNNNNKIVPKIVHTSTTLNENLKIVQSEIEEINTKRSVSKFKNVFETQINIQKPTPFTKYNNIENKPNISSVSSKTVTVSSPTRSQKPAASNINQVEHNIKEEINPKRSVSKFKREFESHFLQKPIGSSYENIQISSVTVNSDKDLSSFPSKIAKNNDFKTLLAQKLLYTNQKLLYTKQIENINIEENEANSFPVPTNLDEYVENEELTKQKLPVYQRMNNMEAPSNVEPEDTNKFKYQTPNKDVSIYREEILETPGYLTPTPEIEETPSSFTSKQCFNSHQVKEIKKHYGIELNYGEEIEEIEDCSYDYIDSTFKNCDTIHRKMLQLSSNVSLNSYIEICEDPPPLPARSAGKTLNSNSRSCSKELPPLPPRRKDSSSVAPDLPLRTSASILSPSSSITFNYPVTTPPTSTESLVKDELNSCSFANVNAQKSFTDELRKELFKNEQVESSNSIEVEEKISDIIYGRKSLQYDNTYKDHFLNNAVRLSYLSLQTDETLSDVFDSDDEWDDSPEEISYNQPFVPYIKNEAIPLQDMLQNPGTQNLKWSEIMLKLQIEIKHINKKEQSLQDAKYELISSEWSFSKALNILHGQFVQKLFIVLKKKEESVLFSYIDEVRDCSDKLLGTIKESWINNAFSESFCEILCRNLENNFDVYVHYCANQVYSEALLGEIISDKNRSFKELLTDIQIDPICNGLHLHAYQLVPIRKINSLPCLLENILKYLSPQNKEYERCKKALYITKQLVQRCNSESKMAKDHIKTKKILGKLEFPKNNSLKLNRGDVHMRLFIKSDTMTMVELSSTLFGKKVVRRTVFVFLFNDIFVVAKKSSGNKYSVIDYCFRINMELDSNTSFLSSTFNNIDTNTTLFFRIRENKDLKRIEMVLSCKNETDAIRWIEALDPPDTAKKDKNFNFEMIRKVIVQRNYAAVHSDEISLTIGEIYSILRETPDGWSFGQRDKDGECGWFQTENVIKVDDVRQRVTDVKQKYRPMRP